MFFMDSGLAVGKVDGEVPEHDLHQRYWSYCVQTGLARPVSQSFFRKKAREFEMDIGFKIIMRANKDTGTEEAFYSGLSMRRK
jgi:hypothetical protein